jgi:hypothetical protein
MSNSSVPDSHDAMSKDVSELIKSFSQATANQKLDILNKTINAVEDCKPLLFIALDDENLLVRFSAYKYLAELGNGSDAPEIGVRLDPGDRIYIVYESYIGYTDEDYFVSQNVDLKGEVELEQMLADIENDDWESEGHPDFESYLTMMRYEYGGHPIRKTWNPLSNKAIEISEIFHIKYILENECLYEDCFSYEQYQRAISWCQQNDIAIEEYQNKWGDTDITRIAKEFRKSDQIERLADFMEAIYGKLAFVYEEVIKTPCHMKLDLSL